MAAVGVLLVAIGAVGAVTPGLPTTVFLMAACWCFARSCPWLEDRLVRIPLFRPFLVYLEPGAKIPPRAKAAALLMMWAAVSISVAVMVSSDLHPAAWIGTIGAAVVGTVVILRK